TRVTPVKGECPRPLDDRVVTGGEEDALSGYYFKQSCAARRFAKEKNGLVAQWPSAPFLDSRTSSRKIKA
ncbi:MAG: hypothetical protein ACOYOI_02450, partial [Chthoniobacterales bacterium]